MLDARAPPADVEVRKALPPKGVDVSAAIEEKRTQQGFGEPSRTRQEAVDPFSEALRHGRKACPPYVPSLAPRLGEASRAPQAPARKRAADAGKDRQRQNDLKTSFLDAGQLAPSFSRYAVAGEVAGAWGNCGAPELCSRIWPIY